MTFIPPVRSNKTPLGEAIHEFQRYFATGREYFHPDSWFHFDPSESIGNEYSRFIAMNIRRRKEVMLAINSWLERGSVEMRDDPLVKYCCFARFDAAINLFGSIFSESDGIISSPFGFVENDGEAVAKSILLDWWDGAGLQFYFSLLRVQSLDGNIYTFLKP